MAKSKVDVIIPSYNYGKYVDECLSAVVGQSFEDFEVILIDNGSTDDTREKVKPWTQSDRRIRFVINEKNLGFHGSVNKALSLTDAEFVVILPVDDLWHSDFLKRTVEGLSSSTDIAMAYTRWQILVMKEGQASQLYGPFIPHFHSGVVYDRDLLLRDNWIPLSFGLFRRKCFEQVGGLTTEYHQLSDYNLWLRMANQWPFHYTNDVLGYIREHGENWSKSNLLSGRCGYEHLVIHDKIFHDQEAWSAPIRYFVKALQVQKLTGFPLAVIAKAMLKQGSPEIRMALSQHEDDFQYFIAKMILGFTTRDIRGDVEGDMPGRHGSISEGIGVLKELLARNPDHKAAQDLYGEYLSLPPSTLSVLTAKNGKKSLRIETDDMGRKSTHTVHSLYDPEGEARQRVEAFAFEGQGLLIVLGLGLGYHVAELFRRFEGITMVVVEPLVKIFEMAKAEGVLPGLIDKAIFIVGKTPEETLQEVKKCYLKSNMASLCVFPLLPEVSAFMSYFHPITTGIESQEITRCKEGLSYPAFKEETLRVTLLGDFFSKEIEDSLLGLGHRASRFPAKKEESVLNVVARLSDHIREFKPDFILTKNHQGFDQEGVLSGFLKSIRLPVASWWIQCPDLESVNFGESISDHIAVFTWNRSWISPLKEMGFESVTYLPLATDEQVFKRLDVDPAASRRYAADVGFMGKSYLPSVEKALRSCPAALDQISEKVAQKWVQSRKTFDEVIKKLTEQEKDKINTFSQAEQLEFKKASVARANLFYRLLCIKTLTAFHPTLFGDAGWAQLLGKDVCVQPELDYVREAPLFYNACKINFNSTNFQMRDVAHQKLFDVPACQGFLLTDHQNLLGEIFEVGKEIVTYKDVGEIPNLVRFYLKNDAARRAIAARGQQRVLAEHTYAHRINTMISVMRERYQ